MHNNFLGSDSTTMAKTTTSVAPTTTVNKQGKQRKMNENLINRIEI